jgi:DNA-binding NarL/FixJ family response regulator
VGSSALANTIYLVARKTSRLKGSRKKPVPPPRKSMSRLRILIADDDELSRQDVRRIVERTLDICGEAVTGREAVEKALKLKPNVVVLNASLPDINVLEATRQIRHALPGTEVLLIAKPQSEELFAEAVAAGVRGVVLKRDLGTLLPKALQKLRRGKISHPARPPSTFGVQDAGALRPSRAVSALLTAREQQIVTLIAECHTSKNIADSLHISAKTVETHRANILNKLQLHSVSELVRYAIRNRLVEP